MTTPVTPTTLRIAEQLRDMSSRFKTPSHERGVCNAAIQELDRLHAENKALKAALSESVAAEREACALICYKNWQSVSGDEIRARGTP